MRVSLMMTKKNKRSIIKLKLHQACSALIQ